MCHLSDGTLFLAPSSPRVIPKAQVPHEAHVTLRRGPSLQNTLPSCPPQAASWPSGELETVQPASSWPCVKYNHVWQYLGVQKILTDPKAFLGRGTARDANRGRATVQATRQEGEAPGLVRSPTDSMSVFHTSPLFRARSISLFLKPRGAGPSRTYLQGKRGLGQEGSRRQRSHRGLMAELPLPMTLTTRALGWPSTLLCKRPGNTLAPSALQMQSPLLEHQHTGEFAQTRVH